MMPYAAIWMDLEIIILNEVSQRQISYNATCMQNLKIDTNELIYKIETDSQTQKTHLYLPKRTGGGGVNQEFGINIYTLLYIKQITNKDLLYIVYRYYMQYFIITYDGKESEKE